MLFPELALTLTEGVTFGLIIIVWGLLVAVADVTQDALLVTTQVMASLFTKALLENVLLFVPTFVPFFFH
jgi:hypothetical protein